MMIKSLTSILTLSLSLFACAAGSETAADTTPPAAETEVAAPEPTPVAPAETAEAEVPAEAAPAAETEPSATTFAVETASFVKTNAPLKSDIVMSATPSTNNLAVSIGNLKYYCSPAPSFVASADSTTLTLTMQAPAAAVSKCFAPHDLQLQIALPGRNNLRTIKLISDKGAELATAEIGQ